MTARLFTDRTWRADGFEWRTSAHQVATVAAQRRPEDSQDVWEHVVTCPDLVLVQQYAELQRDFLLGLEARTIPLDVDRSTSNAATALARLRAKAQSVQNGADDLRAHAAGLRATAGAVATWGLTPKDAATQIAAYGREAVVADAEALDRTAPMLPMQPGLPVRRTHDYVRNGTSTLFAALEIATGTEF